jgi:hypothetical protein
MCENTHLATLYDMSEANDMLRYVHIPEPILAEGAVHFMSDQTILVQILSELNDLIEKKSTTVLATPRGSKVDHLIAQAILLAGKDRAAEVKYSFKPKFKHVLHSLPITIEEYLISLFGRRNYDKHFKNRLAEILKTAVVSFSYFIQKLDTLKAQGLFLDFYGQNAAGLYDMFVPFVCEDDEIGMILFRINNAEAEVSSFL